MPDPVVAHRRAPSCLPPQAGINDRDSVELSYPDACEWFFNNFKGASGTEGEKTLLGVAAEGIEGGWESGMQVSA